MKRLLALLALLVAMAAAVAAAATPAQKLPLTKTNRDCTGQIIGSVETQSFGFVNLIKPANGKVVAAIVVQGATVSATYKVRVIRLGPEGNVLSVCCTQPDCTNHFDGALVTDSSGYGNANIQANVIEGAISVWVDLNNQIEFSDFVNAGIFGLT